MQKKNPNHKIVGYNDVKRDYKSKGVDCIVLKKL